MRHIKLFEDMDFDPFGEEEWDESEEMGLHGEHPLSFNFSYEIKKFLENDDTEVSELLLSYYNKDSDRSLRRVSVARSLRHVMEPEDIDNMVILKKSAIKLNILIKKTFPELSDDSIDEFMNNYSLYFTNN